MEVVNVRKKCTNIPFSEWENRSGNVYIGRAVGYVGAKQSKWANPFPVKTYGREKSLRLYRAYILKSGLINCIHELDGKVLGCWCKPDACHGDILVDIIKNPLVKHKWK